MEGPGLQIKAQASQPHVGLGGWQDHLTQRFPSENGNLLDNGSEAEVQAGVDHVRKVHAILKQLCHLPPPPHLAVLPQVNVWDAEGPPIKLLLVGKLMV